MNTDPAHHLPPRPISIAIVTTLTDTLGNSSPCHIWQLNQQAPFIYLWAEYCGAVKLHPQIYRTVDFERGIFIQNHPQLQGDLYIFASKQTGIMYASCADPHSLPSLKAVGSTREKVSASQKNSIHHQVICLLPFTWRTLSCIVKELLICQEKMWPPSCFCSGDKSLGGSTRGWAGRIQYLPGETASQRTTQGLTWPSTQLPQCCAPNPEETPNLKCFLWFPKASQDVFLHSGALKRGGAKLMRFECLKCYEGHLNQIVKPENIQSAFGLCFSSFISLGRAL